MTTEGAGGRKPPFMTTAEVADRFGRSIKTVQAWIRSGLLPAVKVGRDLLIDPDVLEGFEPPLDPYIRAKPLPDPSAGRNPCAACGGGYKNLYPDPWGGPGGVCRRCWDKRKREK